MLGSTPTHVAHTSTLNRPVLIIHNQLAQCLETLRHMPHVPLLKYIIRGLNIFQVFTKLIAIQVELTGASISKWSCSMLGITPSCAAYTSAWGASFVGLEIFTMTSFMGVVWTTFISRQERALTTWICNLVILIALLNESSNLCTLKFKTLHKIGYPTKHGKKIPHRRNNEQIFLPIDFQLKDLSR